MTTDIRPTFAITLDDHHCRPITADDWREALKIAIVRAFGRDAWSPSREIYNGHGYIDIYRPIRGTTSSGKIADHVRVTITEA